MKTVILPTETLSMMSEALTYEQRARVLSAITSLALGQEAAQALYIEKDDRVANAFYNRLAANVRKQLAFERRRAAINRENAKRGAQKIAKAKSLLEKTPPNCPAAAML